MAIVWVFILGFIMLGLIAGDSNKKTAKERAYLASIKLSKTCEEYLSVWLTFFVYAFMEPDLHEDPYSDARRDVAARCRPGAYLYLSEDFWPPINDRTSTSAKQQYCQAMGPRRRYWTFVVDSPRHDWLHVPDKEVLFTDICKYEKRYDELVDLYDWWFRQNDRQVLSKEDTVSSEREKKLRKAIEELEFAVTDKQIRQKNITSRNCKRLKIRKRSLPTTQILFLIIISILGEILFNVIIKSSNSRISMVNTGEIRRVLANSLCSVQRM